MKRAGHALRAGVIGLGVGEQHIAGYRAHPDCRVVALSDTDPGRCKAMAAKYPELEVLEDPFALLARGDIDVVSIASPDDAHYAQIIAALDAGKHLFVEKPVCLGQAEFDEIRRRLKADPEIALSSNLILRASPRFMDLRRRIGAGDLGDLYCLEADYNYGRIAKIISGWRGRIPDYSVMLGGGVHVVDLLLWLTGKRVLEVAAFGNNICTRDTPFRGPDAVLAILRFEDRSMAKVTANFGCVFPHFHRLLAYGTKATFENGFDGARIWRSRDPGAAPERVDTAYPGVAKGALIPAFVERILRGTPAVVTENDVMHTMQVCFAIDRAVASGKVTPVEWEPVR
jgi:predicted dehydrogenase